MQNQTWHRGYKETKNVIHNDIGVTKEEILEVFRQVAKEEIGQLLAENSDFTYQTIREVIQHEMIHAISEHRYPKVNGHMHYYGKNGRGENSFKDYVAGVMKEEIIKRMESQFEVNVDILSKNNDAVEK